MRQTGDNYKTPQLGGEKGDHSGVLTKLAAGWFQVSRFYKIIAMLDT